MQTSPTAELSLLDQIYMRLRGLSETARLDAQVLLAHITQRPRSWIAAHPEVFLNPAQIAELESSLARLEQGEPLPYVLGEWEFYGLRFKINPAVLIPRPETELLVETALNWFKQNPARRLMADVGTGSGCIAISLAVCIPGLRVFAMDCSVGVLAVASENVSRFDLEECVELIEADLFSPARPGGIFEANSSFDLICANLPYIPSDKLAELPVSRWEPPLALDGGKDGLDLIRRFLSNAGAHLLPGGLILLEIEFSQGQAALALACSSFPQAESTVLMDISGNDRLIMIQT